MFIPGSLWYQAIGFGFFIGVAVAVWCRGGCGLGVGMFHGTSTARGWGGEKQKYVL